MQQSIGNDIVDLVRAKKDHHPRFMQRVFTESEREAIADSHITRSLFWAAKEAAYKAIKRIDSEIVFSPSKFEFNLETNLVNYKEYSLNCESIIEEDYVSVVAATNLDTLTLAKTWISSTEIELKNKDIRARLSAGLSEESQAVRILAIDRISSLLNVDNIEVVQLADTPVSSRIRPIPYLKIGDTISQSLLSFSHHGRFVMTSFVN